MTQSKMFIYITHGHPAPLLACIYTVKCRSGPNVHITKNLENKHWQEKKKKVMFVKCIFV